MKTTRSSCLLMRVALDRVLLSQFLIREWSSKAKSGLGGALKAFYRGLGGMLGILFEDIMP